MTTIDLIDNQWTIKQGDEVIAQLDSEAIRWPLVYRIYDLISKEQEI